jgi:hypothetical protein
MKYVLTGIAVLALATFFVVSCSDSGDDDDNGPPAFSYPHSNGSEWVYNYTGAALIRYVISGNYNHPSAGDTQQLYSYTVDENGNWVPFAVEYLKVSETEVRVYTNAESSDYVTYLKFPLTVGKQWDAGLGLSANVTLQEHVTVPAGGFDTYKIDYSSPTWSFTIWWPSNCGGYGAKNHGMWTFGSEPITIELASKNLPSG